MVLAILVAAASYLGADTTAELRIGLSGPNSASLEVSFGSGAVILDLPAGASFPADFEKESSGLLRGARLTRNADGRSRLELMLGSGLVDRVSVAPEAITVVFRSRIAMPAGDTSSTLDAYRIGSDDRLQIAVAGSPEMTRQVIVDKTGTVMAPLIGDVPAAGSTVAELTRRVTELLTRDYLVDPRVDIQVVEYRSQFVIAAGEVRNPGRVALRGGTDLKEALAEVGGFGPEAGEEIEIARRAQDGTLTTLRIDRSAYERGESNPRLAHGDLINVTRATYVFVNGEVRAPGKIRVERGLTLLRVIALSGGFTDWANAKSVRLLRAGGVSEGEEYNVRAIEVGKSADPELRGGEIVVVRRRFL